MLKQTIQSNLQSYRVDAWADGYVEANGAGQLCMGVDGAKVSLAAVTAALAAQGVHTPVLLRFPEILEDRVVRLKQAFATVISSVSAPLDYQPIYPVKVNQQRCVVQTIAQCDGVGLEVGSKPELLLAIAASQPGGRIVCNGYKDAAYIRLALLSRSLGLDTVIVIEKPQDAHLALKIAEEINVQSALGVRIRLASVNSGKWQNTGGEKGKFGLTMVQLAQLLDELKNAEALRHVKLLHCHMGSQISSRTEIENGVEELAQLWRTLHEYGAPIEFVDVGGGLAVDYEGLSANRYFSMEYGLAEYAEAVVAPLADVSTKYSLPPVTILTESGRAMTAHHAVLITDVSDAEYASDVAQMLSDDKTAFADIEEKKQALMQVQQSFAKGEMDFTVRVAAEKNYVQSLIAHQQNVPDKYFCNFSLFQSLPDIWGLNQVFPIMPIHRLDEAPTQQAVLYDLTCDSDGAIADYVYDEGIVSSLSLHRINKNQPYWLGFFLVGAYQEILGDFHNLFGDTHAVNVRSDSQGGFVLDAVEPGDTTAQLLDYIHFDADTLRAGLEKQMAHNDLSGAQRAAIQAAFDAGLSGYTYLS